MINLPFKIGFNNNYHFEVINTKTNEIRQTIDTHNIILDNFWKYLPKSNSSSYYVKFDKIAFGSGTREPSSSDRGLEKILWRNVSLNNICSRGFFDHPDSVNMKKKYPTSIYTIKFTIPAAKEFMGTITEIGFSTYSESDFITRALLKDAEGNPISIEKTDIDKIIITITIELTMESLLKGFVFEDTYYNNILFNMERRQRLFENILSETRFDSHIALLAKPYPSWGYRRYYSDPGGIDSYENVSATYDWQKRQIITSPSRILTTEGNDHYYNAIGIQGIGYWPLPNYDVFPPQTLSNMKVGTGDGVTTEFKCPLNLFIKNTDKIYKNDVLLTRGIDYTIEHDNNQDALVELSLGNFAEITGGYKSTPDYGTGSLMLELFKANIGRDFQNNRWTYYGWRDYISHFDNKNPLFFVCQKPEKCNTLRLVKDFYPGTYILSFSDDGVEYTPCCQIIIDVQETEKYITKHFDLVTAKYWKLETTATNSSRVYRRANPRDNQPFLGYVGKGIIFKEPPALNDVITMEAQIDRPFKNENFVIDMSVSITF